MAHKAKIFENGRSQAVRLPKEYRFECDEVYIRRDEKTGDVVLSRRPDTWDGFFALDTKDVPARFHDRSGPEPGPAQPGSSRRHRMTISSAALLERNYMLDTNIASHVVKGTRAVRNRLIQVPMHAISVSAVTDAELRYGVAKRGHPQKLGDSGERVFDTGRCVPWTQAVAQVYADLRAAWEAAGTALGPLDMMIAAHAKAVGATLVTNDQAFSRIPAGSLALEDWTK